MTNTVRAFLYAFGDDKEPLDETVRILDEITTDYILETCHTAAKSAEVSGRQKIKVDDFKFAIRKDEVATGRVKELFQMEKHLKESRKQFDTDEGRIGLERGGRKKKGDGKEELTFEAKEDGKEDDMVIDEGDEDAE